MNTKRGDKFDIETVRKVLGDDAANKLLSDQSKYTTPPITTANLESMDRYTRWLGSGGLEPKHYESKQRLQDRKSWMVLTEQLVAVKPTIRLVINEFLKAYRSTPDKDRFHFDGAYMFCTEGCGKKFLPAGMDIHLNKSHGIKSAGTLDRLERQAAAG